jgi:microcystin-dependent protein
MRTLVTLGVALLLARGAAAAILPTSFVVGERAMKKALSAGDLVTAELFDDAACTSLVGSQTLPIEDVEVRERVKPYKVKGAPTKPVNTVRLYFTFDLSALPTGDLSLRVTSPVAGAVVGIPGDCQPQEPLDGGGGPAGGGQPHENRSPYLGLRCIIAVSGFQYPLGSSCDTTCLGDIRWIAATTVPSGWAACDGSLVSIASNAALFSLLGTTYGGDGTTTFALPDARGRSPVNVGTGPGLSPVSAGQKGGAETVTLTEDQLPVHSHP